MPAATPAATPESPASPESPCVATIKVALSDMLSADDLARLLALGEARGCSSAQIVQEALRSYLRAA